MKNKIYIILIANLVLITIFNLIIPSIKSYATSQNCTKITENIEYFNASLYDYNATEFNEKARGITIGQFNNLSMQEKYNIDKTHTLIGNQGDLSDLWHGKNVSLYGGLQNGMIMKNGVPVVATDKSSTMKGILKNKLVNNNVVLTYQNNNNTIFFPTYEQAEAKGNVGSGKPYQQILRNYKLPFIKENSGYYYMDSNYQHWKQSSNNKFELHKRKCWRTF